MPDLPRSVADRWVDDWLHDLRRRGTPERALTWHAQQLARAALGATDGAAQRAWDEFVRWMQDRSSSNPA
jgi:hypothetical protein